MYALDTDTVTLWLHGHEEVARRVDAQDPEDLAITIITVEEVLSGWYRMVRQARNDEKLVLAYQSLQEAVEFMSEVRILAFDGPAARRFRELRTVHRQVGTNDLRIAAITLAVGATLVSRNLRHFQTIAGLDVEDWS